MLFNKNSCRSAFLFARAISMLFVFLGAASCTAAEAPAAKDLRASLIPPRLTIAMWDFSWLNGHYPGGWAENFDQVTDELIERKFNTVRIDVFPMLIDTLIQEVTSKYTIKARPTTTWGFSTVDHEHDVVGELKAFMQITKRKGLYVILSSWGEHKEKYADRGDFWRAWETTLDILQKDGLLEHVLYVDFDQEFPYFSPFAAELKRLAGEEATLPEGLADAMEQAGQGVGAWNAKQMAFVKDYFESTLAHFGQKYPTMRFTFSLTSFWNEVRAMKVKGLDVLELHVWIPEPFYKDTGFYTTLKKERDPENNYKEYMAKIREVMKNEEQLKKEMVKQLDTATAWAAELGVPLTTTEAWGPWWHMDHPDLEWDWLYDWCEYGMGLSGDYGFWGSTPWNYSHPYWENWRNVDWYRRVNGRFLESQKRN